MDTVVILRRRLSDVGRAVSHLTVVVLLVFLLAMLFGCAPQWAKFQNDGFKLAEAGRYDQGITELEKALAAVGNSKSAGEDSASIIHTIGWVFSEAGDYESAHYNYDFAFSLCRNYLGPNHYLTARTGSALGLAASRVGFPEVGESLMVGAIFVHEFWVEMCLAHKDSGGIFESGGGRQAITRQYFTFNQKSQLEFSLGNLTTFYVEQGRHDEALRIFADRLMVTQSFFHGVRNVRVANVFFERGVFYGDTQRFTDAEADYRLALTIYAEHERKNLPAMAECYHRLGDLYLNSGDSVGAEQWFSNSLEHLEKAVFRLERGLPSLSYSNYEQILRNSGREEAANAVGRRVTVIWNRKR
jgi:tetratricopeptide (TPR) repeat protein